mgnify:FL=1
MSILEVSGLKKTYSTRFGASKVEALRNINFSVEQVEYVAIMGESGSGKTTLLNMIAALDKPTGGRIALDGIELGRIGDGAISAFRRDNLGFVFQEFNLLDTFSMPFVFACIHLAFAFPMIERILRLFNLNNVWLFAFATVISVAVFALLYTLVYRSTSNAYYAIVSGAREESA